MRFSLQIWQNILLFLDDESQTESEGAAALAAGPAPAVTQVIKKPAQFEGFFNRLMSFQTIQNLIKSMYPSELDLKIRL